MATVPLAGQGERLAALFLRTRGYRILARNLRTPFAEVDILAGRGALLVVAEVKTLTSEAHPEVLIRRSQQQRLARAALWLAGKHRPTHLRIDLLTVVMGSKWLRFPKIRHLEGAWGEEVLE